MRLCEPVEDQRLPLRTADGLKPTDWEAAICMDSPVFGLRPWRAARFLTSNVPNPMIWTFSSFFTPLAMEERTASRASSAERLVASFPRARWMDSISSALFMAEKVLRIRTLVGKRKSLETIGISKKGEVCPRWNGKKPWVFWIFIKSRADTGESLGKSLIPRTTFHKPPVFRDDRSQLFMGYPSVVNLSIRRVQQPT